jgi:hypothetical protein
MSARLLHASVHNYLLEFFENLVVWNRIASSLVGLVNPAVRGGGTEMAGGGLDRDPFVAHSSRTAISSLT